MKKQIKHLIIVTFITIWPTIALLLPTPVLAQCSGVFGANTVCGSSSGGLPSSIPLSSISGVSGPGSSTSGCAAPWANTAGTLLASNCGFSLSSAGTATFAPTAASLNHGIVINQSPAGSPAANFYADVANIAFGALSNAGNNNYGLGDVCTTTSTSLVGQTICRETSLTVSNLSNSSSYPDNQFVGHQIVAIGSMNTTNSDASISGGNDNVQVTGTGWTYLIGREIDLTATQPIVNKEALRIVQASTDANAGSTIDSAIYAINQSGAVGWKNFIYLDATNGLMETSACIVCLHGTQTVAKGIDLSAWTISGDAFKSNGFFVDGSGNINGLEVAAAAASGFALGANPFAIDNGSFVVVNGEGGNSNQVLLLGGTTSYIDVSTLNFRNSGGATNYASITSAGLVLYGSSSGAGTLEAPAAASTYAWTLPATTDTLAGIAAAQTLTNKTLTTPITTGYAISGLPGSCTAGMRAHVTNGVASPTFGGAVSTTGSTVDPVFCIGSSWVYG